MWENNITIVTYISYIFQSVILGLNVLIIVYLVSFYLNTIGYFKYNIQDLPFERIYHEIALRTDMMKMSFNNLVISLKIHKIFPGLLYRKADYYFINCQITQEVQEYSDELYDKVENLDSKEYISGDYNKKHNNSSNDAIHSKSTIDSESVSFK